jgi:hypothetical protein
LILIPLIVAAVLISPVCSQAKEPKDENKAGAAKIRFDDLQVSTTPEARDGGYILQFSRDGNALMAQECAFKVHMPEIVEGFPLKECRSLFTYCFSGGAHCCMTVTLATHCGSRRYLNTIDFAHSDARVKLVDADKNGTKEIKVIDWQFAYYGPEGSELQLSFADSPPLTRLLVFGKDGWRVDRMGEFERFYTDLCSSTRQEARASARKKTYPARTAGKAIEAAYYCLMAGKPSGEAVEVLDRLLPQSWKPESGKIFDDIKRSAAEFNPIEPVE